MLLDHLIKIKPQNLLDVGCGCGNFTSKIAPHCKKIHAIDTSEVWIQRAQNEQRISNVHFELMNAKNITFPDNSFDVVISRSTLHHIDDWKKVIDHMLRVSQNLILIEEPFDDLRSISRQNTYDVQQFFLELQNEIGYSHYNHIQPHEISAYLNSKNISFETKIKLSDEQIDFYDYFGPFDVFIQKSSRKEEWIERYEKLKKQYADKEFTGPDTILYIIKNS